MFIHNEVLYVNFTWNTMKMICYVWYVNANRRYIKTVDVHYQKWSQFSQGRRNTRYADLHNYSAMAMMLLDE